MKNKVSLTINVNGDNNTIIVNDKARKSSKKSFMTVVKALGKLIRSLIVNISVLLFEIFTRLG